MVRAGHRDIAREHLAPAPGMQHLAHDALDGTLGEEVVMDHRERDARIAPRRREKGKVLLVERPPVAAMDENEAGAVALARRKEIDRFAGRVAVAALQIAAECRARLLRAL